MTLHGKWNVNAEGEFYPLRHLVFCFNRTVLIIRANARPIPKNSFLYKIFKEIRMLLRRNTAGYG